MAAPLRTAWRSARTRIHSHLSSWLLPASCVLCGASGADFCAACLADLDAPLASSCHQCGLSLPDITPAARCGACLREAPVFERTLMAALYRPPFDQLVLALKFHAQLAFAPMFAELLARRVRHHQLPRPDLILPVPLSVERLAERGFNQAMEIARPLARRLGVPVRDAAVRLRHTPPQASLPVEERQHNIRNAFHIPVELSGQVVAVVDDVMTTGATLNDMARALKQAGARSVVNLVVTRTPLS